MRLINTLLVLDEDESERIERQRGAQPDESRSTHIQIGTELPGVHAPHQAVNAISGNHQVGTARDGRQFRSVDLALEVQVYAQPRRAFLQDAQQLLTGNAAESVAAGRDRTSPEMDVNVVPVPGT